jgi:hypothetical protein
VPLPEGLEVTEVIGAKDLTMYSPETHRKSLHNTRVRSDLGKHIVSSEDTRRTFSANMGHNIPNHSQAEINRFIRAAEQLELLKK